MAQPRMWLFLTLQQMTAAYFYLLYKRVCLFVRVPCVKTLIVILSLPGYISPAGRQDGHHHGSRRALIRAA